MDINGPLSLVGKEFVFKALHMYSGIGGAALGMQMAEAEYKGVQGRFETLAGIDVDESACKDFERITGAPAHVMDLFSRKQYRDFHGHEPPPGWREVVPEELLFVCNGVHPDMVFLSPPCKGLSGLLPQKSAKTPKYQALNYLVVRGMDLMLKAFEKDPPAIVTLENVPRIISANRGAWLLKKVKSQLKRAGYAIDEATHDCGELGGLGQHRKRYLLIARHKEKVPSFVYKPPKLRVKAIGEILEEIPLPDDPASGKHHRMPKLQFKTWRRLALIPPGKDWRALEEFGTQNPKAREKWEKEGVKTEGEKHLYKGKYAIVPFDLASRTVVGGISNFVADPHLRYRPRGAGTMGAQDWRKPGATVVANCKCNGSTPAAVADPIERKEREAGPKFNNTFKVLDMSKPCAAITAGGTPSAGGYSVADDRTPEYLSPDNVYVVVKVDEETGQILEAPDCVNLMADDVSLATHVANGATCVADPRAVCYHRGSYGVNPWDKPAKTVTIGKSPSCGSLSVADPRVGKGKCQRFNNKFQMLAWDKPASTVTGIPDVQAGAQSVCDVRLGCRPRGNTKGPMGVQPWDCPASTVFGALDVHSGPAAVADLRPTKGWSGKPGLMGVLDWNEPAKSITGSASVTSSNCPAAVADVRIPKDSDRCCPLIIALDGSYHRPLTTYELAMLQSFPSKLPDGSPFELDGNSDTKAREKIGNAVPPLSAKAMAEVMLNALLPSLFNEWVLGSTEIWVSPKPISDNWKRPSLYIPAEAKDSLSISTYNSK